MSSFFVGKPPSVTAKNKFETFESGAVKNMEEEVSETRNHKNSPALSCIDDCPKAQILAEFDLSRPKIWRFFRLFLAAFLRQFPSSWLLCMHHEATVHVADHKSIRKTSFCGRLMLSAFMNDSSTRTQWTRRCLLTHASPEISFR